MRHPIGPILFSVVLLSSAFGCGEDDPSAPPPGGGGEGATDVGGAGATGGAGSGGSGAGGAPIPGGIAWEPCPILSEGEGDAASCAEIEVPAQWAAPDGPTITLFLKRVGDADADQQLWMLNGGPGAAGSDFEPIAEYFVELDPQMSVYLLDHRGTGRSTRLGCPEQEALESPSGTAIEDGEWDACLAYVEATFGDVLGGFTTTDAAGDVGWLIEKTKGPGQDAVVWGGSYGTLWTERYLQLFPDQATAISMTGIAHPAISFSLYDVEYDVVGAQFLDACGADPFCSGKLGADASLRAYEILDAFEAGACPDAAAAGLDRASLQSLFAFWLLYAWDERALVPAILYRLDRCNASDVAALSFLAAVLAAPAERTISDDHYSTVLGNHISLSELWDPDLMTLEELQAVVAGSVFSLDVGPRLAPLYDAWPRYAPDGFSGALGPTNRPMLLVQGEMDPATPAVHAQEVAAFFAGANQAYVEIPGAPHSWASPTPSGTECSLALLFFFAQDPTADPYDCVGEVLPLDFAGTPAIAAYLGTDEMWEGLPLAAAPIGPAQRALSGSLARARRLR